MKFLIIVITFTVTSSLSYSATNRSGIIISYSESADYFEIMENLSVADNPVSQIYKTHLRNTFFENSADKQWLDWYQDFRKKYYRTFKVTEGSFFSELDLVIDPVMESFFDANRPLLAITNLQDKLNGDQLQSLGKFYEHFNFKIAELVRLSAAREAEVANLEKELKKANFKNILNAAATFFSIPKHLSSYLRVHFVWFPKEEDMQVSYANNYIVIRIHPEKSSELKKEDIMKILINYLMRVMPSGQKKVLTDKMLGGCDLTKYFPRTDILQEPLSIIIGGIYLGSKYDRKNFDLTKTWSTNPWINTYAKLLYPKVEKSIKDKQSIMSADFWDTAITTCDDLLTLGKLI